MCMSLCDVLFVHPSPIRLAFTCFACFVGISLWQVPNENYVKNDFFRFQKYK